MPPNASFETSRLNHKIGWRTELRQDEDERQGRAVSRSSHAFELKRVKATQTRYCATPRKATSGTIDELDHRVNRQLHFSIDFYFVCKIIIRANGYRIDKDCDQVP